MKDPRHPVLLYSQKSLRDFQISADLQVEFEIIETSDREKALSIVKAGAVAAMVVDDRLDPDLSFLTQAASQAPSIVKILWTQKATFEQLSLAINKGRAFRIVSLNEPPSVLGQSLIDGLSEFRNDLLRVELVRRSARHNRELEELTLNLEGRVEERTKGILVAKEQEEDKLNRIRKLVKFVKELTGISSVDELFTSLKIDLKGFHQVVTPVLIYCQNEVEFTFVFGSKSQVIVQTWPQDKIGRITNQANTPALLSQVLSRPVAKILSFPLEIKNGPAFLFLEHTANLKEVRVLEGHIQERKRPIEMALDRLLIEGENNYFSYRWEKTFDSIQSPVAIIDRDFKVLRSNRKFFNGYPIEPCYQSFAGRTSPCDGCPVPGVIEQGHAKKGLIQVGRSTYQVQSYPIQLVQGGPTTNVVSFYQDITLHRELQRKVLQSEKMSAIGLLAGNVAHELNNPLTGIRSLAQVLKTQVPKGGTARSDLEEIEKAAARSQGIIRNLLDFTSGGDHKSVWFSLDEVVHKTLPFLKSIMRNHRMRTLLKTQEMEIFVEPSLLQQVVFNLINNACQAMKDAGTLTLQTDIIDPTTVLFQVIDTGPGIQEAFRDRIFEPFFTTKSEGHGTGLGLSLSKEIVEKFKGQIGFESKVGEGTRFWVRLPARKKT